MTMNESIETLKQPEVASSTRTRSWLQWTMLGASVLVGVVIDRVAFSGNPNPFATEQGRMLARGALQTALTEQRGNTLNRETRIEIGVSYLAKNSDYCRTFTLKDAQALAGVACRRDSQWEIDALTRTKPAASGAYRMAGATVPALILGLVEDTIAGDPLDAEQETEARGRNWER